MPPGEVMNREEFERVSRAAGWGEQDYDAAYGAFLDEATVRGATGKYRRAIDAVDVTERSMAGLLKRLSF